MNIFMQRTIGSLRSASSGLAILSTVFGVYVGVQSMLLNPISQRVERNGADIAKHDVELARQSREQARQDIELARHGAELAGFETELARQGDEQVRQDDRLDGLAKELHLFSGEVNVKFVRIDVLLETMDASKLPISAAPVEQSDNADASAGGMIWRISGLVDSPEFSTSNSVKTFCAAMI